MDGLGQEGDLHLSSTVYVYELAMGSLRIQVPKFGECTVRVRQQLFFNVDANVEVLNGCP